MTTQPSVLLHLRNIFLLTLGILVTISLPTQLDAGNKNNKNNNRNINPWRKGKASELKTVDKVNEDHLVVGGKTYYIRTHASITVNGKKATLQQIEPGMQISISARVKGFGKDAKSNIYEATRIVARTDNELAEKAKEENKKRQQNKGNRNRR